MGVCKVKNIVIGEGMPKICVPVVSNNHQDIITDLIRLQSLDIDLIELRIDYFNELLDHQKLTELFKAIASMAIKQGIILTYRSVPEGGNGKLSNDEYMQLYSIALESGAFDIYDVELSSGTNTVINLSNLIHQNDKKIIMSSHDSLEADIIKIAVMPEDYRDVLLLLETTLKANELYDKPLVTMSMSSKGIATRILGEQFGSAITFGKDNNSSAPGQIEVHALKEVLKVIHHNN